MRRLLGIGAVVLTVVIAVLVAAGPLSAEPIVTMTDLGTLGGNYSYAVDINGLGQVLGGGTNSDNHDHAFLWEDGVMTDLGTLGGIRSLPVAISNAGQVIGNSHIDMLSNVQHAFLWEAGVGMTDLGTLGGAESRAIAINESGQIVGNSLDSDGNFHAFLWEDGEMTDLGTLGGNYSRAVAINNTGQVVGYSPLYPPPINEVHAFLWQNGVMTDLGTLTPERPRSEARAMNDLGQVTGDSLPAEGSFHAFLWEVGVMTDLGTLGGPSSRARAINNLGQVVGDSRIDTLSYVEHAFLWEAGVGMTDLGTLGGLYSTARAINDFGQVVGGADTTSGVWHAFLWADGVMIDLDALGEEQSEAKAINSSGQIVGSYGYSPYHHAVLWTVDLTPPTPSEQIQNIIDEVQSLIDTEVLGNGQGNALVTKQEAAANMLDKGNDQAACNVLQAFINQVEAMLRAGELTPAEAQSLIDATNNLVSGICI